MLYYRIERKALPIGDRVRPHIFSTLFCEFVLFLFQSFSTAATTSQLFAAPLRSQHFSFVTSSFDLFPSLLSSVQLIPSLSQPISTLLASSHLFSQRCFAQRNFYTHKLLHTEAFTQSKLLHREAFTASFYTEKLAHTESFYTQQGLTHSRALRREAFTRRKL